MRAGELKNFLESMGISTDDVWRDSYVGLVSSAVGRQKPIFQSAKVQPTCPNKIANSFTQQKVPSPKHVK